MQNTFKDNFTKKEYKYSEALTNQYNLFSKRYLVGLSLIAVLVGFDVNTNIALLIGIGFIVISEFRYRTSFLNKCTLISESKADTKLSNNSLIINTVLYSLFSILLFIYAYSINQSNSQLFIIFIGVVTMIISIIYLVTFLKQK